MGKFKASAHITGQKCLIFHKWKTIKDDGITIYEECQKCNKRKIQQTEYGYQPIDWNWLLFKRDNIVEE